MVSGEVSGLDEILVSAQALEAVLQLVWGLAWLWASDWAVAMVRRHLLSEE